MSLRICSSRFVTTKYLQNTKSPKWVLNLKFYSKNWAGFYTFMGQLNETDSVIFRFDKIFWSSKVKEKIREPISVIFYAFKKHRGVGKWTMCFFYRKRFKYRKLFQILFFTQYLFINLALRFWVKEHYRI